MHACNLTSAFFINFLKVPLNVGLPAKCLRPIRNRGPESISGDNLQLAIELMYLSYCTCADKPKPH